jgi:hypothetical protein
MFIRYNETNKYYEYDTSVGQNGSGPWIILPIDYTQLVNVPPATLPPNIAYTDFGNLFTVGQTINGALRTSIGIYERNRIQPMGFWQDVPFNAANFYAGGGGTWTIGAAAVIRNRFTMIGLTIVWDLYISWFSGDNIVNGTVNGLFVNIPGGFSAPGNTIQVTGFGLDAGVGRVDLDAGASGGALGFSKRNGTNFTSGAASGLVGTFTFEVIGASINIDV